MTRTCSFIFTFALGAAGVALAAQPSQSPPPQPAAPEAIPAQAQQAPSQRPQSSRPPSYSERYGVLTQRNIFLRDRSRGSSGGNGRNGATTSPSSTQPSRRPVEETLLLRGIVVEQGEVRAYFEDVVNSTMVRVAEGDKIARGRVVSIGLDAVEYEPTAGTTGGSAAGGAGKPTFVLVGNDLTGKIPVELSSAAAIATTGPVMPSGIEGLNPNDPNLTLEQRLKIRRAQELKK